MFVIHESCAAKVSHLYSGCQVFRGFLFVKRCLAVCDTDRHSIEFPYAKAKINYAKAKQNYAKAYSNFVFAYWVSAVGQGMLTDFRFQISVCFPH